MLLKNVAKNAAKQGVKSLLGRTVRHVGADFVSEAVEEGLAEIVAPYYARMTYDPDARAASMEEVAYAAFIGGLSGVLLGGAGAGVRGISDFRSNQRAGNDAVENGYAAEIMETGKSIAEAETADPSGSTLLEGIKEAYGSLVESVGDGEIETAAQRRKLGALYKLTAAARFLPKVEESAAAILNAPQMAAERFGAMGLTDENGQPIEITAEKLTEGINYEELTKEVGSKKAAKAQRYALRRAISQNRMLLTLAVSDVAGKLMLDAESFAKITATGGYIRRGDYQNFLATASPEQKADMAARLGIAGGLDSVSFKDYASAVNRYAATPDGGAYIEAVREARRNAKENEGRRNALPEDIDSVDVSEYNEITLDGKEMARLQSEVIKWHANKRGVPIRKTLGDTSYLCVIDTDGIVHCLGKEPSTNIHEKGEQYDLTDREQLDTVAEGLRSRQGVYRSDRNISQDGRESANADRLDHRAVRSEGQSDGRGRREDASIPYRRKKAVRYKFDEDGSGHGVTYYSDSTTERFALPESETATDSKPKPAEAKPVGTEREIVAWAKENVRGYKDLLPNEKREIRATVRQGRALGLTDAEIKSYADVAVRTGVRISFSKERNRYTKKDGSTAYGDGFYDPKSNEIVVNPEGTRSAARLLFHELSHTLYGSKRFKKALVRAARRMDDDRAEQIKTSYEEAGRTDVAELAEEIAVHHAEDVLGNRENLERLLRDEPTIGEKILSFFGLAKTEYAGNPRLTRAAGRLYRHFEAALGAFSEANRGNLASETVTRTNGGNVSSNEHREKDVSFAIPYQDAIDQLDEGTFDNSRNTHLSVLEHTPQIYIEKAGAKNRKIMVSWDVAYLAMKKEGDLAGHYHGLGVDVMKSLPRSIEDPLYIVKQKNGRIAAVTKIVVKGKRAVFASIELEAFKTTIQEGKTESKNYNLILTVTDAQPNYLQNTIFSGDIVYNKNNEDPAHFILRLKSLKKALPTYDPAESSTTSISDSAEKINPSGEKNSSNRRYALPSDTYSSPTSDAIGKERRAYQPTVGEKLMTAKDLLYIETVNELHGFEKYLRKAGGMSRADAAATVQLARAARSQAQTMIDSAQYNVFSEKPERLGDGLLEIYKPTKKWSAAQRTALEDYLLHSLNVDRMTLRSRSIEWTAAERRRIAELESEIETLSGDELKEATRELESLKKQIKDAELKDKPVFGKDETLGEDGKMRRDHDITAEESQAIVDRIAERFPSVPKLAERIWAYAKNLQRLRVSAGLITQQDADYMEKLYPHYVPAYRDVKSRKVAPVKGKNTLEVSSTVKRAKGGSADILSVRESLAELTDELMRAGQITMLAGKIYEAAKASGDTTHVEILEESTVGEAAVIELSDDSILANRIAGVTGSAKYKIIQEYILEAFADQTITLNDGKKAVVDRSDALHIANKSGSKKAAQIAKIKELVESARLYAEEMNPEHNKFNYFCYYKANVSYEGETFPVYLNVGRAKNDGSYHIYDVTKKIRDTANRIDGFERPKPNEGYAQEIDVSTTSISDSSEKINPLEENSEGRDVATQEILRPKSGQLTFYRDGKRVTMKVSKELLVGFDGLRSPSVEPGNPITQVLAWLNQRFKGLVTSYNPLFGIRNAIRDLQDAGLNSKHPARFAKNVTTLRALKMMLENSKEWELYRAMGGFSSTVYEGSLKLQGGYAGFESLASVFFEGKVTAGALRAAWKKIHYLLDQYSGAIGDFVLPATSQKKKQSVSVKPTVFVF